MINPNCTVTVTYNGNSLTLPVDQILSPPVGGCYSQKDYVERISEIGIITQQIVGTDTITEHISPHCICQVDLTCPS